MTGQLVRIQGLVKGHVGSVSVLPILNSGTWDPHNGADAGRRVDGQRGRELPDLRAPHCALPRRVQLTTSLCGELALSQLCFAPQEVRLQGYLADKKSTPPS